MKFRISIAAVLLALSAPAVFPQSVPNGGINFGQVWTASQWLTAWQSKADVASPAFTGAITLNGIIIPSYPRTTAEITASITPVNYAYPQGNPFRYGAAGDCTADDTVAMGAVFKIGGFIPVPSGACFKITSAIKVFSNVSVTGAGKAALIKLVLAAGAPAQAVLDLSGSGIPGTTGITLSNFAVDGGNAVGLIQPTTYGTNIPAGSAIIVQSTSTDVSSMWVANAWDNGISVGQLVVNGTTTNAAPANITINNVNCTHNGYGTLGGACVDNLAGINVTVTNSVDSASEYGFIVDYGSGALTTMANLQTNNNGKGGYYIGAPDTTLANLTSNFATLAGIWIDAAATGQGVLTGFTSENANQQGVLLKASGWTLSNISVKNASTGNSNVYDAVSTQTSGANISGTQIIGLRTSGATHRYGYAEVPGAFTIAVQLSNVSLNGVSATIAPNVATQPLTFSAPLIVNPATNVSAFNANVSGSTAVGFAVTGPAATKLQAMTIQQGAQPAFTIYQDPSTNDLIVFNGASGTAPLQFAAAGYVGINGAAGAAPTTGWGTPTGASVAANYPGASATLAQTSATVAELIAILKSFGLVQN